MGLIGFTAAYESGHTAAQAYLCVRGFGEKNPCVPQDLACGTSGTERTTYRRKPQPTHRYHPHVASIRSPYIAIPCSCKQTECHVSSQGKLGSGAKHHLEEKIKRERGRPAAATDSQTPTAGQRLPQKGQGELLTATYLSIRGGRTVLAQMENSA